MMAGEKTKKKNPLRPDAVLVGPTYSIKTSILIPKIGCELSRQHCQRRCKYWHKKYHKWVSLGKFDRILVFPINHFGVEFRIGDYSTSSKIRFMIGEASSTSGSNPSQTVFVLEKVRPKGFYK